jgi:nucleotide-binding universal stress UspA family protein
MRILLAVDGSRSADQACDLVAALPWQEGGLVRIVSVAASRTEVSGVPWSVVIAADADGLEDDLLQTHRDALDAAEREIRSARSDLDIQPVLIRGRAASVIVDQAREMDADLVVVGHRGMGRWESMLLGSVSAEVVDHAPCPVLIARDERLGPVILADDGSPHARTAECVLSEWPIFTGLPITVVTVTEDALPYAAGVEPAKRLREAGFDATASLREGDPAQQIIACAGERQAGLIVVGTRGQTGLRRLLLGSVARNVVLHAPCSVLVVRERSRLDGRRVERRREERELVSAFG